MAQVNLGKVAFTWKGPYSAGVSYSKQDVVSSNGDSWVCIADATTGVTPGTNAAKWELFAQGSLNVGGTNGSLIYSNGSTLVALPPGTASQILKIDPATGFPVWGSMESRSGVKVKSLPKGVSTAYRRGGCVMEDGTLRFWGNNAQGQHGSGGSFAARSYPTRTAFPFGFVGAQDLFMSHNTSSKIIDKAGKLWLWGENASGAFGTGDLVVRNVPYCPSDNVSNSIYNKTITQVAHGGYIDGSTFMCTLVRASDGTVHAAGYNAFGQLGMGDTTQRTVFSQVPVLTNVTKVFANRDRYTSHYAITAAGALYAWGYNAENQLGNGATASVLTPTLFSYFSTNSILVADVIPNIMGVHVLSTTGNLYYAGVTAYGNGGTGSTAAQATPILVASNVRSAYCIGGDYPSTVIIKNDNTVWATGYNAYGQLGIGTTVQANTFTQCTSLPTNITKVVLGGTASYGYTAWLGSDGRVWVAGYNGNGQLGVGDVTLRSTPVVVPIAQRTVSDICTYGYTSEGGLGFLLDDGQLLQSGYAGESQLPDQAGAASYVPYPVIF